MNDFINYYWNWNAAHNIAPVIMFTIIGSVAIGREIWWRLKNRFQ